MINFRLISHSDIRRKTHLFLTCKAALRAVLRSKIKKRRVFRLISEWDIRRKLIIYHKFFNSYLIYIDVRKYFEMSWSFEIPADTLSMTHLGIEWPYQKPFNSGGHTVDDSVQLCIISAWYHVLCQICKLILKLLYSLWNHFYFVIPLHYFNLWFRCV